MNRFRNRIHRDFCRTGADTLPQNMRKLAAQLPANGRRRLMISFGCRRRLNGNLYNAEELLRSGGDGGDALRRLCSEAPRIHSLLEICRESARTSYPSTQGRVRVLALARAIVGDGERRLTPEDICNAVTAFDHAQPLEMREIQAVPAALRIALCEALVRVSDSILHHACSRRDARRWLDRGGRKRVRCDELFFEYALRCAAEEERPGIREQLFRMMDGCGCCRDGVVERAHRMEAENQLRLDHLMDLRRLLDSLDWQLCFEAISAAEQELCDDPAGVYANMDDASKGQLRRAAAEIARYTDNREITVVRFALAEARKGMNAFGAEDFRATVYYYLMDDAGRRQLGEKLGAKRRLPKMIPDRRGWICVALAAGLTAALWLMFAFVTDVPILIFCCLPLAWVSAMQLLAWFYPRWIRPRNLLKMRVESVPDSARTLVVLPVLLSSEKRAREMVDHMETLGCLEQDSNIDYLLLGDFRDADQESLPEDAAILASAKEGVANLNARAEREKYFYLHRSRSLRPKDERWMGEGRKRGAITALNRLILNQEDAWAAFAAENSAASQIAGNYRYVVTLDADTEYLPGTLQKLIGTMLHPMNRCTVLDGKRRGYGILQPGMQMTMDACANAYVERSCGHGGVDGYPVSVSDFYQDMTGYGNFSGKGIYDVAAFAAATDGKLPDAEILSHDLIEGILCGAGFLNDVFFYDGVPADLGSDLNRMHRWTRGDWQLLRVLCKHRGIRAVDRMKMIGNLLRSLYAPALLALLILSVWMDAPEAFLLGLFLNYLDPVLHLLRGGASPWRRATLHLALLPCTAYCMLDAVIRALWRLLVSRKHLMDWVPAADAGGSGGKKLYIPGKAAAILLLPGLLRSFWLPAVLGLAALFWVGAAWADDLSRKSCDEGNCLDHPQKNMLEQLARETWHFFEIYVPEGSHGLPPDNVQMDPPAGIAARTSPTNIGLYMLSCLAAKELGLVGEDTVLRRLKATTHTLEKLEKWKGQLYNWYDLNNLAPLHPRYVSAVDSGNLAGCLLLCARMCSDDDLSARMQKLAEDMNLCALYDAKRHLFRIGMDVENNTLSQAHYDLYASEARILSYAAMMLGQVPVKHWKHLSRPGIAVGRGGALLSWSGTMFEYLMPELLLKSPSDSLAGKSCRGVVEAQLRLGKYKNRPWGVSESGYYAFDLHLNYQYRAFGLKELSLSGEAVGDVVAPYAAALALECAPSAAAKNLLRMRNMGWYDEFGMFEAADYLHSGDPRIVRSHMAHHQGMALCAICNVLRRDVLSEEFMKIPRARALRLLLQEKSGTRPVRRRKAAQQRHSEAPRRQNFRRSGKTVHCAVDSHLLHGGNTTALLTSHGAAYVWHDGVQMNRFNGNQQSAHDGMYVHLKCRETGEEAVFGQGSRSEMDAGSATYEHRLDGVNAGLQICISPEDGALYQQVQMENVSNIARTVEITGCFAAALASDGDMRAHPVFQNLFVEGEMISERALLLRRRPRNKDGAAWELVYMVSGGEDVRWETDMEKLTGRRGALGMPGGIAGELNGKDGSVITPCAALQVCLHLEPGEKRKIHFALCCGKNHWQRRMDSLAPVRAAELSALHARAALHFSGTDAKTHRLLQRASALLYDRHLHPGANLHMKACEGISKENLWRLGISGEMPILLARVREKDKLDCIRQLIRAHDFYRMMGVKTDLVLINDHGNDYHQPVHNTLEDMIRASHLASMRGVPGGVFLLDGAQADSKGLEALQRAAVLSFSDRDDFHAQLRAALDVLNTAETAAYAPMQPTAMPSEEELQYFNGYGGFAGDEYHILLQNGMLPPAPWSNLIASERSGALLTERGGGFAWSGNSRSGRITAFANDALREGWGWMFYLLDENSRRYIRLLPGDVPMTDFRVRYAPGSCVYEGTAEEIEFAMKICPSADGVYFELAMENRGKEVCAYRLAAAVDWLMGTDESDLPLLRTWPRFGCCFASGASGSVGYFTSDDLRTANGCSLQELYSGGDMMQPNGFDLLDRPHGGWTLHLPLELQLGERKQWRFALGAAENIPAAYARVRGFRSGEKQASGSGISDALQIETPDEKLNLLFNGFLQAQVLHGRISARTGLYQPGGAYGFRDQLQDMLPMIYYDPARVRRHILYCAARQFRDGDVLHWWHEPYTGVRTKIRDDMLFLPFVTAQYVKITGDTSILEENVPFLMDINIPKDREDIYAPMQPSSECASLHCHCMRAFRYATRFGEHGLCLMGAGDWNDGMNRVGIEGRGESIWLSEFMAACAADYARIIPEEEEGTWLMNISCQLRAAVEESGWDGGWYLRAYGDDGDVLGGRKSPCCRIDAISQAWAVLAGLDSKRCQSAMDAAWEQLVDEERKLIRLLTPPFDGKGMDPGYIAAYPPGIRENGAQYTHGACWLALAWVHMGDAERAHRALEMLLPLNHGLSREEADRYRVEPYVMAADVYTNEKYPGRGGWTWYTGSAAWMMMLTLALLGFERRGNLVRMHALLGPWNEAKIHLKHGSAVYHLICRKDTREITLDGHIVNGDWIPLVDDGREHTAVFPLRT